MEPKIVSREPFTFVSMHYRGKAQEGEIAQLWGALAAREHEIGDVVSHRVSYGLSANMDEKTGDFDYLAAFEVQDAQDIREGMVAWKVPGGTYAVFGCTMATIADTFHHAHGAWLPQSG
jgi:predicted transcriptional regulator YdeE